jgi:cytochrome c peroxidase
MIIRQTLVLGVVSLVLLGATTFMKAQPSEEYQWNLPANFPLPKVPDDNPMTVAKVELGRYLFYDRRLSGNGTQACATCHRQEIAFSDGLVVALGSTGQLHPRNSISLTNSAYSATLTWANPALTAIERQVLVPMFGEFPVELGIAGHEDEVLGRFKSDSTYRELFRAAFPNESNPVNFGNISKTLASFVRTLISGSSPYDQYVRGDRSALSDSAVRGMKLFFGEALECHHCHGGFNFSLSTVHSNTTFPERPFFNTGLYNLDGLGRYPLGNTGLREITGESMDMGRFRPPSLRNVAITAPYMHDGSVATLEEVIRIYSNGGRLIEDGPYAGDGRRNPYKSGLVPGFTITDQERDDLVNFLKSLTDERFISDPRLSDPFAKR